MLAIIEPPQPRSTPMTTQILVPLHTFPDGNSTNIARHVARVAQHLQGSVHALFLNADFPAVGNPLANLLLDTAALVENARSQSRQNGKALLKAMQSDVEQHGIAMVCTPVDYYPTELSDTVSDVARYHDLTILGIGSHDAALRGTAEEVIFAAGRPILLVPEDLEPGAYDHVAIAWDSSRVAARAVADAWPFLTRARTVSILSVTDEKPLAHGDAGSRLADHLRKHDLAPVVSEISTADRPIAETLQSHALAAGAGLLVMGGFGHSRMRDFVLGGATAGILRNLEMPVLISH
jgi:nucleotide-binding universal stress UspA family protein